MQIIMQKQKKTGQHRIKAIVDNRKNRNLGIFIIFVF